MVDRRGAACVAVLVVVSAGIAAACGAFGEGEEETSPTPTPDVDAAGDGSATTDGSTTADASDSAAPRVPSTVGVYQPSTRHFVLRYANEPGVGDRVVPFDGGGVFTFVVPHLPFAGHWSGRPDDWVGIHVSGSQPTFHLLAADGGADVVQFGFASNEAVPLAGDWNGDGKSTIGFYIPSTGKFFLTDQNAPGDASHVFSFGATNGLPVVGDWDGDGKDGVGVYFPGAFFLLDDVDVGDGGSVPVNGPVIQFNVPIEAGTWLPIAGDWDNTGSSRVGLFKADTGTFRLLQKNANGSAETRFDFAGASDARPVAGRWER